MMKEPKRTLMRPLTTGGNVPPEYIGIEIAPGLGVELCARRDTPVADVIDLLTKLRRLLAAQRPDLATAGGTL